MGDLKPYMKRKMERLRKALAKRGIELARDPEENRKRAREAHHGNG